MVIGTHRDGAAGGGTAVPTGWRWVVWGALLAVGLAGGARAQPDVRVGTRVSADSVLVGQRFTVSFVVEHAADHAVAFPDPAEAAFGSALEVLNRGPVGQRALGDGRRVDSVAYEVAAFALDSVRIPAVPLPVVAGGDTTIARAPPRSAVVVSVVGPESRGIYSVAPPAPFPRPLWAWVLAGLVAAALLGALAYYLWWRRQPSAEPTPTVRPAAEVDQTPYEAATAWIRQLESYDLADPAAVKPFYVELSNALRVYLARELNVAALERTTREVLETLERRSDVPAAAVERLRAVLERADLAKFADARPPAEAQEQALADARAALDTLETAPAPASEAVDGVASAAP